MKFRLISAVAVVCALEGLSAQSSRIPAIVRIMDAELQRNMQVLTRQPVPAYYAAYAVHDTHTSQVVAAFGAILRTDNTRQRLATVEVRVGDYLLDNTHPMRGDARAMSPRLLQASLPMTRSRFARRFGGRPIAATNRQVKR